MRGRLGRSVFSALLVALAISAAYGESRGLVQGKVTYPWGAPAGGVEVSVVNQSTGQLYKTQTGPDGRYLFDTLPAGQYTLEVEAEGFQPQSTPPIRVSPKAAARPHTGRGPAKVVNLTLQQAVSMLPPPPNPSKQPFTDPIWNVWAERSSEVSFQPLQNLQPKQDFALVIDLAALQFRDFAGDSIYSQPASGALADWLAHNPDVSKADIELLLIPDRRYVALKGDRIKRLTLDLKKIRAARSPGIEVSAAPLDELRAHGGDTPFNFGLQTFQLAVAGNAPLGNAPLALSIWADGKPIDELAVDLCIAAKPEDACPPAPKNAGNGFQGVDLSGSHVLPDAAMHLIERGTDVVGVFRCNSCSGGGQYLTWEIGQQSDGWLADRVNEIVQHLTPPVPADYFPRAGDDLYNLIFPDDQDPDEAVAERAFGGFFASAGGSPDPPPSLFVRMLPAKPGLTLFPMALMRAPLPDGKKDYLGFRLNIESPLELQDYAAPPSCISDWVLFVPPADAGDSFGDLADARGYAGDWIDHMTGLCPGCTYTDPDRFSDWLLGIGGPNTPPAGGQAIVVLSQYKSNSLFFSVASDNPPSVPSSSIRRRFGGSSFAILDACGTAAPGGSEFIRALNAHGVDSLISTSAAIPGPLGGLFLKHFMEQLAAHPDFNVSRARYEAVKILSQDRGGNGQPFGAQALEFTLAGNGRLRLCDPHP